MLINVAVAVIFNDKRHILVTQRSPDASHGGLWEFPGGKIESDEAPIDALHREIWEEVGLNELKADFLSMISHEYTDKKVNLFVYCVNSYQGKAVCRESQSDLLWLPLPELRNYSFPAANLAILSLLENREKQKAG